MKDEMDILREVSSIASAHGSRALSEILGKQVRLVLPHIEVLNPHNLINKVSTERPVIGVKSRVLSGVSGSIVLILEEKSAFQLIKICYTKEAYNSPEAFTEMGLSVIKEIGNVVIGSYVGALSIFLKTPVIPSIPTLINGPFQEIVNAVTTSYDKEDYILLVEAEFEEIEKNIKGGLYFILTPEAMQAIQEACRRILKSVSISEKQKNSSQDKK